MVSGSDTHSHKRAVLLGTAHERGLLSWAAGELIERSIVCSDAHCSTRIGLSAVQVENESLRDLLLQVSLGGSGVGV